MSEYMPERRHGDIAGCKVIVVCMTVVQMIAGTLMCLTLYGKSTDIHESVIHNRSIMSDHDMRDGQRVEEIVRALSGLEKTSIVCVSDMSSLVSEARDLIDLHREMEQ